MRLDLEDTAQSPEGPPKGVCGAVLSPLTVQNRALRR